jgi:hypothetical protein
MKISRCASMYMYLGGHCVSGLSLIHDRFADISYSGLYLEEADELVAQFASPGGDRLGRADHAPYKNG